MKTAQAPGVESLEDDMMIHESGNADASLTVPVAAGQLKLGAHIIMNGDKPCKIIERKDSKTGKHGHLKCRFTAIDIFTGMGGSNWETPAFPKSCTLDTAKTYKPCAWWCDAQSCDQCHPNNNGCECASIIR